MMTWSALDLMVDSRLPKSLMVPMLFISSRMMLTGTLQRCSGVLSA